MMPELLFQLASIVLIVSPLTLCWRSMLRAGRAANDAPRRDADMAAILMQSTRAFVLRNWLATLAISTAALAFFLHTSGIGGLLLWTIGFVPVLVTMTVTVLLLAAARRIERTF